MTELVSFTYSKLVTNLSEEELQDLENALWGNEPEYDIETLPDDLKAVEPPSWWKSTVTDAGLMG